MKKLTLLLYLVALPILLSAQSFMDTAELPAGLSLSLVKNTDPNREPNSSIFRDSDTHSFHCRITAYSPLRLFATAWQISPRRLDVETELLPELLGEADYDLLFSGITSSQADALTALRPILDFCFNVTARLEKRAAKVWIITGVSENEHIKRVETCPQEQYCNSAVSGDSFSIHHNHLNLTELAGSIESLLPGDPVLIEPASGADDVFYEIRLTVNDPQWAENCFEILQQNGILLKQEYRMLNYLVLTR